jgi:NADH dehydrogenase/NADH:ubiquinone oxidoreductase subunit G
LPFEPEEESPIVFLRLNKNFKKRGLKVTAVATKGSIAMDKLKAEFIKVAPGAEPAAVAGLALTAKSVILVGERASESAGLFSAVAALAAKTGAKIAYIPRRAGERGALKQARLEIFYLVAVLFQMLQLAWISRQHGESIHFQQLQVVLLQKLSLPLLQEILMQS